MSATTHLERAESNWKTAACRTADVVVSAGMCLLAENTAIAAPDWSLLG